MAFIVRDVFSNIVNFVTIFLSPSQFGFLCSRSTLYQLLTFFNILFSSPSQTDVIYLDFREAFDSVAHNEFFYEIWTFGITGNLWLCIESLKTECIKFVSIAQSLSSTLPVVLGVPQGILGLALFPNDLPPVLKCYFLQMMLSALCLASVPSLPPSTQ